MQFYLCACRVVKLNMKSIFFWELFNYLLHKDKAFLLFFRLLFSVVFCFLSLWAFCRFPSVPVTNGGLSTQSPYVAAFLFEVLISHTDLTALVSKKTKNLSAVSLQILCQGFRTLLFQKVSRPSVRAASNPPWQERVDPSALNCLF